MRSSTNFPQEIKKQEHPEHYWDESISAQSGTQESSKRKKGRRSSKKNIPDGEGDREANPWPPLALFQTSSLLYCSSWSVGSQSYSDRLN
jgi:hypothetical protein